MQIFPEIVECAYIQRNHGFQGHLKIKLQAELINLSKFPKFIWVFQYGKPVPFLVKKFKSLDELNVILDLEDVLTEEDALLLKNELCYCKEEEFDNYFTPFDSYDYLINLLVVDQSLGNLGPIIDVVANENSHATLVVHYNNQEIMIPFVDAMVKKIDEEKQQVLVVLPEGLLDLFLN